MSLTKYGTAVRENRRQLGLTLSKMAAALGVSPAFLSAMETGRSKVPMDWVEKVAAYFCGNGLNVSVRDLKTKACESNDAVSLEGLPPQHKMLIAGFANSDLTQEQLAKIGSLLSEIYGDIKS